MSEKELRELLDPNVPIDPSWEAYLAARTQSAFYNFGVGLFIDAEKAGRLTRASFAKKVRRKPSTITRWLSTPLGWDATRVALFAAAAGQCVVNGMQTIAIRMPDAEGK